MKKILICGLPGTGKTTLAGELKNQLQFKGYTVTWFNADDIRNIYDDWDFSAEGRIRQAKRMRDLSKGLVTDYVICDFVAPTKEIRDIFNADYTIFMDTEKKSDYEDTNKAFERPIQPNYTITAKAAVLMVPFVIKDLLKDEQISYQI